MADIDFERMLPPECFELLQHVWDLLDGQLTPEATDALERHIGECDGCRKYRAFQQAFFDAVAKVRASDGAPPALRERIAQSLAAAGFSGNSGLS
jgi:mycothiol system anti-sigma-R factor